MQVPAGYFIEYGGQFETQQRATQLIIVLADISVIGMLVVLLLLFPSVRAVLHVLNALPTAFIGGVFALVITQRSLTVARFQSDSRWWTNSRVLGKWRSLGFPA